MKVLSKSKNFAFEGGYVPNFAAFKVTLNFDKITKHFTVDQSTTKSIILKNGTYQVSTYIFCPLNKPKPFQLANLHENIHR